MAREDEITICRCEDVTAAEVVEAIRVHGARTLEELKRVLRIGMGPCQGRTCLRLAARILARELGVPTAEVMRGLPRVRPPIVPVPVGHLALIESTEGESESGGGGED